MKLGGAEYATKKVTFSDNVKQGAPPKNPSDMNAFERIAYVQSLDFDKEEQKEKDGVDEDFEDGKLTKEVARKYVSIHMPVQLQQLSYKLKLNPARTRFDAAQTNILKEEVTSASIDLMRLVLCLERGGQSPVFRNHVVNIFS